MEEIIILEKLYNSPKKWKVYLPLKTLTFGDSRYEDYTIHKDSNRKKLYISRHKSNENWNDISTKAFWSRWLLWNKPSIYDSIKSIEKKFGLFIKVLI